MRLLMAGLLAVVSFAQPAADPYAALWSYAGTWQVSPSGRATGAKPDTLVNQCAELGKFFTCAQSINGQPGGLVVFIAGKQAGHYETQTIMPDGRATGMVALDIAGDKWTYSSRRDEYGKTTFFRNTNNFTAKNKIHFEQAHSGNGKDWTLENSGDEVRTAAQPRSAR